MEATLKRSTPWSEFFTFAGSSSNATTQPSIRSTKTTCAKRILYYPADHGRNMVGDTGDVSPPLFQTGDIKCHVPPLFSLGFVFREVSKRTVMLVTFCLKSFSC